MAGLNRELDELLEEFGRDAAAYIEERRRSSPDRRRRRALYAQLARTHRALCELRASMATWLDAWALVNPSSRVRMSARGTWPLPEFPSLREMIAERAARSVHEPMASAASAQREPARHLRLLPLPRSN